MENNNKIQELTNKIFTEAVEKGKAKAQTILESAKTQEQALIEAAQKEADRIVSDARKQADELAKNTKAELQLFSGQAVEALKTEIANLLTAKLSESAVKSATTDKEFMQKVILTIVEEWAKNDQLTVRTADAANLQKYFEANAKDLLARGVKIEQVNGIKTAFEIVPADGSYKVTFGDQEFINYFKEFLRPQLVSMLF